MARAHPEFHPTCRPAASPTSPHLHLCIVYSATKFAVEAMTDSLRREMRQHGVSVSIVEPAYVKTAIGEKSSGEQASDKWVAADMLKVCHALSPFVKKAYSRHAISRLISV